MACNTNRGGVSFLSTWLKFLLWFAALQASAPFFSPHLSRSALPPFMVWGMTYSLAPHNDRFFLMTVAPLQWLYHQPSRSVCRSELQVQRRKELFDLILFVCPLKKLSPSSWWFIYTLIENQEINNLIQCISTSLREISIWSLSNLSPLINQSPVWTTHLWKRHLFTDDTIDIKAAAWRGRSIQNIFQCNVMLQTQWVQICYYL